jgi:hypothetical protein
MELGLSATSPATSKSTVVCSSAFRRSEFNPSEGGTTYYICLRSQDRRRASARHPVRFARLGSQTSRADVRNEIHDRDLLACAQTNIRILRVPIYCSVMGWPPAANLMADRAQGTDVAERISRTRA